MAMILRPLAQAYVFAKDTGYALPIASLTGYYGQQQHAKAKARRAAEEARQRGRNVMARDPIASREGVYGQIKKSGVITFMQSSGTKNEYLHIVLVLAAHEVEEIGDVYFGSDIVPLDGSGNATGKYAGHARVKKFLGVNAGERDTDLETESGGVWTENHLGRQIARLHDRLKWNVDVYPQGITNIQAIVKGKKVRDWRVTSYAKTCEVTAANQNIGCSDVSSLTVGMYVEGRGIPYGAKIDAIVSGPPSYFHIDLAPTESVDPAELIFYTRAYSANSALVLADYLTDPKLGRGFSGRRIRSADVVEAANICDEQVGLAS